MKEQIHLQYKYKTGHTHVYDIDIDVYHYWSTGWPKKNDT